MPDNDELMTKRDKMTSRLREKYPDKAFEDDEEVFGQIYDDYDEKDQELESLRGERDEILDAFERDGRAGEFFMDMVNNGSPLASYIRRYGPELRDLLDDPNAAELIAQEEEEYLRKKAESDELEAEYENNMEQSIEDLREFKDTEGASDEEIEEVIAAAIGIVRDGVMGKFTPETLQMILKAVRHDGDVATAQQEGEVAGRNAKITEKLRKPQQGDGIANLDGKNNAASAPKKNNIFGLAADAKCNY